MLRWRLIGAAAILTPLLILLWADYEHNFGRPGIWLVPVAMLVTALATGDLLRLMAAKGNNPAAAPVYAGSLFTVFMVSVPMIWPQAAILLAPSGWLITGLAVAVAQVMMHEMVRYRRPEKVLERVAFSLAAFVLVGFLFSFIVLLRQLGNHVGLVALLSVVIIVKFSDTGAYTFGRLFGRHKMVPILSPKKTWEGAVGGIAVAMLASWLVFAYLAPWLAPEVEWSLPVGAVLVYGLLLAVAGIVGDLMISLLKRDSAQKDSANWLPGLGGFLDVIDSLLLAAPLAWMCWELGLIAPV